MSESVRDTSSKWIALLTLSLGLFAIAFAPIFIRLSETELGANGTVLNRMLVFLLAFGFWEQLSARLRPSAVEQDPEPISGKQWVLLVSVGVISVLSLVLWAMSLQYTTVAKSMLLNNLTPIFTSSLGWLLLGKRFSGKFLLGMAIALLGAIALGFEDVLNSDGLLIGDLYALLSAVFLGSYFLVVEQLRIRFSGTTILLWRCAIGSLLLLPLTWFTEAQLFPQTTIAVGAVLGLGIISEGFGQRLIANCLDQLSSSFVALFLLLEPIISAILAWFIFHESLSPVTWVGFAVVLGGIVLAQSSEMDAESRESPEISLNS